MVKSFFYWKKKFLLYLFKIKTVMDLTLYIKIIIFILITIQTIAGVGILVIGTPVFLFLNFNFIELLYILLPLSILTSFANILYFKYIKKGKNLVEKNTKIKVSAEHWGDFK